MPPGSTKCCTPALKNNRVYSESSRVLEEDLLKSIGRQIAIHMVGAPDASRGARNAELRCICMNETLNNVSYHHLGSHAPGFCLGTFYDHPLCFIKGGASLHRASFQKVGPMGFNLFKRQSSSSVGGRSYGARGIQICLS